MRYRLKLKETHYHLNYNQYLLTESEKVRVKEIVTDVKKVSKLSPDKIEKNIYKKNDQMKHKMEDAKATLKKNGIDVDSVPKYVNDYSVSGIIKTAIEWTKDVFRNFSFKRTGISLLIMGVMYGLYMAGYVVIGKIIPSSSMSSQFMKYFLGAVVLAPLIEETTKYLAAKTKTTKEWFLAFNTLEFSKYTIWGNQQGSFISNLKSLGLAPALIALPINIFVRLIAVFMHVTTSKIISDENSKIKSTGVRTMIGVLCHMFWNAFSILSPLGAIVSFATLRIITYVYYKLFRNNPKKSPKRKPLRNPRPELSPA